MNHHPKTAIEESTGPKVAEAPPGMPRAGAGPGTVLLLGLWIGLVAGFLDLGLLIVNKHLINRDFYRLGGDFTWIIPTGVTILVLAPAIVIALIARIRRGASAWEWRPGRSHSSGSSTCARGFPWNRGRRCSYAVGSPRNSSRWYDPAGRRSCGSCASRCRCLSEWS
jgi:hypothetical protein